MVAVQTRDARSHAPLVRWGIPLAAALLAAGALAALALAAHEADAGAPCGPGACYSVSDGSPQNYRWIDMLDGSGRPKPSYNWVEIAPGGSPGGGTTVPGTRDGACGPAGAAWCIDDEEYSSTSAGAPTCVAIGFKFNYYGTDYDCAWVSDNGFVMLDNSPGSLVTGTMTSGVCYGDCTFPPGSFPTSLGPDRVIASYWTDQDPFYCGWTGTPPAWGSFTRTLTSGSTTMFVVEWSGVLTQPDAPWSSGCPGALAGTSDCTMSPGDPTGCIRISHQLQLHKSTNNIEVMLKSVKTPAAPGFDTYAGLGIENGAGTRGLNYGYGLTEAYTNHAVRYFPNHAPQCPTGLAASVLEDVSAAPLSLSSTDPDGDTVTYGVTTPSLRGATVGGPTGASITYTPPADFYGTDTVSFTVKDVFGLAAVATCELTVTVKPVNDAPRVGLAAASLPAATVGTLYTKTNVITGIASGPTMPSPNEFDEQGIANIEVVSTTPDIFGSGPTFACVPGPLGCTSATVSFVADTAGSSTICVVLVDEGGTDTTIGDKWRGPLAASGAESPICMTVDAKAASSGGGTTPPPNACSGPLPTAAFEFVSSSTIQAGGSLSLRDRSTAVSPKTIATRTWDFGDGLTSSEATPVHPYPQPGVYKLRLTAIDSTGCAAFKDFLAEVQVPGGSSGLATAGGGNAGPLADAGPDQTVREGSRVELQGVANGYAPGDVTYRWIQAFPESPKLPLEGADEATLRFTAPALADPAHDEPYVFALQVTDLRTGAVSPYDLVQVDVTSRTARPLADAGPDVTVVPGKDVTLDGSASSDPDGDALHYAWTQVAGPTVALLSADTAKPKLTTPESGAAYLDFELSVTDGTFTARDTVRVWLQAEGTTPPAFLVQPVPGRDNTFRFLANVPGTAFAWDFGDGSNGTGAAVTHTYADAADYKVTFTVLDDARASPAERIVTATAPARSAAVGAEVAPASLGPAWPWLVAAAAIVAATAAAFWLLQRRAAAPAAAAPEGPAAWLPPEAAGPTEPAEGGATPGETASP